MSGGEVSFLKIKRWVIMMGVLSFGCYSISIARKMLSLNLLDTEFTEITL